ncbi:MAG: hypothetical protein ACP5O2_10915 [Bacteroidales bacterium]
MKKFSACFLLLVILFQAGIYYPLFFLRKAEIRRQVRSMILNNPHLIHRATFFVFTQAEWEQIQWFENEKEFRHNSRKFDVICIRKEKSDRIEVVALEDGREMALYSELGHKQEMGKSQGRLTHVGTLNVFFENPGIIYPDRLQVISVLQYGYLESATSFLFLEVPVPPPWCV